MDGADRSRSRSRSHRGPWWLWASISLAVAVALGAWLTSASATTSRAATSGQASPVTAVPDTTPPRSSWDSVAGAGPSTRLGRWVLKDRFLVLAQLADQGLATLSQRGKEMIVFRGGLSVPPSLRQQGWVHVGDPGAWHGYLFDAYQGVPGARDKMFQVTSPDGTVHRFVHPLASGEEHNNSFAAVSPDGQWMVSGEWGQMRRLLVFATPLVNPASAGLEKDLPMTATIGLDRPVRDVQGCTFVSDLELLCSTSDPGRDLWPTPDQLLSVTLPHRLDGRPVTARVASLGQLPLLSQCRGIYEVEGIGYDRARSILRVEVRPPGQCGLSIAVYEYRPTALH